MQTARVTDVSAFVSTCSHYLIGLNKVAGPMDTARLVFDSRFYNTLNMLVEKDVLLEPDDIQQFSVYIK